MKLNCKRLGLILVFLLSFFFTITIPVYASQAWLSDFTQDLSNNVGLESLLGELREYEGDLVLKDLNDQESSGALLEDIESNFETQGEMTQIKYDKTDYKGLLVSFSEEETSEIFFLFRNEELIYLNVFNYLAEGAVNSDEDLIYGKGIINSNGGETITYQIDGDLVLDWNLHSQADGRLTTIPYLIALEDVHLYGLSVLNESLNEADASISAFLEQELDLSYEDMEVEEITLDTEQGMTQLDQLFDPYIDDFVSSEIFLPIYQEFKQAVLMGQDDSPEILTEQFGRGVSENNVEDYDKLTYIIHDYGYQVYELEYAQSRLSVITESYYGPELFGEFSLLELEQIQRLSQVPLSESQVYGILGIPTFQFYYPDLDIKRSEWIRYGDTQVASIRLEEKNENLFLEIIDLGE